MTPQAHGRSAGHGMAPSHFVTDLAGPAFLDTE